MVPDEEIESDGASELVEDLRGAVLVLTIDRPQVRNALDLPVAKAIAAALQRFDSDPALGAAVLTGADGVFSSGSDLRALAAGRPPYVEGRGYAGLAEAPPAKPLIAAVEGFAIGGGFEVALACDLIVASSEASFGLPEVKRGLVAAGGALLRLPTRIPRNVATELALTGASISAARAAELGLVNRLTAPGGALAAAIELAEEIAAHAPLAIAASKELLGFSARFPEPEAWARQAPIVARIRASDDAAEGSLAFQERRPPRWKRS